MSELAKLREQYLDLKANVAEAEGNLKNLREVLARYQAEEADAKEQAKRGELPIDDLVAVQTRRKSTEELIAESEGQLRQLEAQRTGLEARMDREQAIEALEKLAREGANLKAAYNAELRALAETLQERMEALEKRRKKLGRHRDATVDALHVFGVSEHPHTSDHNAALFGELEERGIDRAALTHWLKDGIDGSRLVKAWEPPAFKDAMPLHNQSSTPAQNLAHILAEIKRLAVKRETQKEAS